jgi:hypothetical protein
VVADRQVEALDERRIDVPTLRGEHLRDPSQGTEDDPETHENEPAAAVRFNDLRIE